MIFQKKRPQNDELLSLQAEIQRLELENKILRKYVEPEVLETVHRQKQEFFKLGGSMANVSVMFIDIRNFTSITEKLETEAVVDILNRLLNAISSVIIKNEGVLDKLMGDAVMCFWSEPFSSEDYVYQSVKTALEILPEIQPQVDYIREKYDQHISIGIGIQCGNAVLGNIGSNHRLDFTVIGDVVNTAARLESHAKNGNTILIGEKVYEVVKNQVHCEEIPEILQLKGKEQPIKIFSVKGFTS